MSRATLGALAAEHETRTAAGEKWCRICLEWHAIETFDEVPACNSALAAETAGITYKQLDHWTRLGHLHPVGGSGTGNSRAWTDDEVEIARRMGRLTAAGLPLGWSAQFARNGWPAGELAPGILVSVTE